MNYIRELVSGNWKRLKNSKYNLDLTYITNNIIAMSFPSNGIMKYYRNNIKDISNYLWENHKNQYLIINISNMHYSKEYMFD